MMKNLLKIFLCFSGIALVSTNVAFAQKTLSSNPYIFNTSTSTTPHELTVEEAVDFRNQILDLFGIPRNTPITITDFMVGNTKDIKLPQTGIPKIDLGPLQDLKLVVNETSLAPGRQVQAVVVSLTSNLGESTVTWYHNGNRVLSGKGAVLYTFTLGADGSADLLRAAVTTNTGVYKEVSKTVRPGQIHFTWFANTYTPEWYRGKALPAPGTDITIVAIPDFRLGKTRLDPANLTYEWFLNDSDRSGDPRVSGTGKNSFVLKLSTVQSAPYKITVRVKDTGGRIQSEESVRVESTMPLVGIYPIDPLYGLTTWLSGLNYSLLAGETITLQAEPYYVPRKDIQNLMYSWGINDKSIFGGATRNDKLFRLSSEAGSRGIQRIRVSFENQSNVFERGSGETRVNVIGNNQIGE
jgi:hypothetical protein